MTPDVFALLNVPAVTALVPSARIRGQGFAGDNPVAPYITWQGVGGEAETYIADPTRLYRTRVQIDCWAKTMDDALAIAAAVHDALDDHGQPAMAPIEDYDQDARLYRVLQDWHLHATR